MALCLAGYREEDQGRQEEADLDRRGGLGVGGQAERAEGESEGQGVR